MDSKFKVGDKVRTILSKGEGRIMEIIDIEISKSSGTLSAGKIVIKYLCIWKDLDGFEYKEWFKEENIERA